MDFRIPQPRMPIFCPPVYACRKTERKLIPDGNLNKAFWADAPWTEDFVNIEGDVRGKPRFRTRAKILWDDQNIYFGAELEGNEIWANVTERDDVIFRDNDFEIFIDPDSDTHCYCEYEMNARNTQWDLFLTKPYRDNGKPVDSFDIKGLASAVKIDGEINNPAAHNTKWSCEVVMPFRTLSECGAEKRPPVPGEYWRVNFSRVQWQVDVVDGSYRKRTNPQTGGPYPEDNWVWSPTGIINMHYPELWGFLFFCDGNTRPTIPEDERIKWELRRIYYQEHACYDTTGRFTAAIQSANPQIRPRIQTTDHFFEISCPSADGSRDIVILADGRTFSQAR